MNLWILLALKRELTSFQKQETQRKLTNSSSNYIELAEKFDMTVDQNGELIKKIEILEQTKTTSKKASKSIFETKIDVTTFFIDLIDESSSPSCNGFV